MNWTTETNTTNQILHATTCSESSDQAIQASINRCADYAFTLLDENIGDSAMYCLFIWDSEATSFSIVVTDETKKEDAKHVVTMTFSDFSSSSAEEQADTVKYWITDHLTTSPEFLAFSLIAGFVRGGRDTVELM